MEHLVALDSDTVTLYRFDRSLFPPAYTGEVSPHHAVGIVLDTETTGTGITDRVVELALLPFLFDKRTGELLGVARGLNQLQDPGIPISPEASAVNGITDEDVRGKRIDWPRVVAMLKRADIVIAHNAKFDRPMVHKELNFAQSEVPDVLWGCSLEQINWKKLPERPPAAALGSLCAWYGFFFSAHRALGDCQALLHLLDVSKQLLPLWKAAQLPMYVVQLTGKTYEFKDDAKGRRYQYSEKPVKCWQKSVATLEEAEIERQWFREHVYGRGQDGGITVTVPPKERFL